MAPLHSPYQNQLLAALPAAESGRLAAHLELVPMALGELLYAPGQQMRYAYFPANAIVSLHQATESGASAETAGVGSEGVVGISFFMGGTFVPSSAVVHVAGLGYRLEGRLLKQEFSRAGAMRSLLLRYTQALVTQMIQTAACTRQHSLEQQLCRWLLQTLDRVPSSEQIMGQELVAGMLGIYRDGFAEAAGMLQHAGCIRYRQGHIAVLERAGLESRACACYAAARKEQQRLLTDMALQGNTSSKVVRPDFARRSH